MNYQSSDIIYFMKFPQALPKLDVSNLGRAMDLYRLGSANRWDAFPASMRFLAQRWGCSVSTASRSLKTFKKIMGDDFKIIPGDRLTPQEIHLTEPGEKRNTQQNTKENTDQNTPRNTQPRQESENSANTKHPAEHLEEHPTEQPAEQIIRSTLRSNIKIKTYSSFSEEEIKDAWSIIKNYDGNGHKRKLGAKRKRTIGLAIKHVGGFENWRRYADWLKSSAHPKAQWLRTEWPQIDTIIKNKLEDYWILADSPAPSVMPTQSNRRPNASADILDMIQDQYISTTQNPSKEDQPRWIIN